MPCSTSRPCARCSEKTSDAWVEEDRRDLGDRDQGLYAASCLQARRYGAAGLPLSFEPTGRRWPAKAVTGTGGRTPTLRLSPAASSAEARRGSGELEEALPALSRGAPDSAQARWPQACARHESADGDPARRQPALEPRLCLGHADRRPPLPDI